MSLQFVSQGLTDAVMFKADGETVQPAEVFYKKAILVERGSFRPVTYATNDMLDGARRIFLEHCDCSETRRGAYGNDDREFARGGELDHADFLARVDILRALGRTVFISKFGNTTDSRVSLSLHRQGDRPCHGCAQLDRILNENTTNLEGGILEALGRMLKED